VGEAPKRFLQELLTKESTALDCVRWFGGAGDHACIRSLGPDGAQVPRADQGFVLARIAWRA